MSSITIHGGINEIGGNKILVESSEAKVWLDFGLSFSKQGLYYDEWNNPRKYNGMTDYFDMGLLPNIKGLYRHDYLKKSGIKEQKLEFDALFLSHAHADHANDIEFLHKDMPIYCGETAKLIMQSLEETRTTEYLNLTEQFTGKHYTKNPPIARPYQCFRTGDKIKVKDITLKPIHVDHSMPGCYGMIIHADGKSIAYTGDIRLHGARGNMTKEFITKAAKEKVDVLLCEGTRLDGKPSMTESQVKEKIVEFVKATKGMCCVNFPIRDTDRMRTMFNAAKETDKKLIINVKQAHLLKTLEQDKNLELPNVKDMLIYVKRKKDGKITEGADFEEFSKEYSIWEREFINLKNSVTFKDIKGMQKEVLFYCDFFSLGEMIDIKPIPHSTYIHSQCEPFNEEMILDMKRVQNWLDHFGLKLEHAHASGHAGKEDIKEIVQTIDAKKVVPIHTEHPEVFKEFKCKLEIVQCGEAIRV